MPHDSLPKWPNNEGARVPAPKHAGVVAPQGPQLQVALSAKGTRKTPEGEQLIFSATRTFARLVTEVEGRLTVGPKGAKFHLPGSFSPDHRTAIQSWAHTELHRLEAVSRTTPNNK